MILTVESATSSCQLCREPVNFYSVVCNPKHARIGKTLLDSLHCVFTESSLALLIDFLTVFNMLNNVNLANL